MVGEPINRYCRNCSWDSGRESGGVMQTVQLKRLAAVRCSYGKRGEYCYANIQDCNRQSKLIINYFCRTSCFPDSLMQERITIHTKEYIDRTKWWEKPLIAIAGIVVGIVVGRVGK